MKQRSKDGIRRRQESTRFPRGGWEVRYVDPEGRTKRRTFATKKEATSHRDDIRMKMKDGSYIAPDRAKQRVRAIAEKWFDALDVRPTTRAAYDSMLRTYLYRDPFGNTPLNAVTRTNLLAFKNRLDETHRRFEGERRELLTERRKAKGKEPREHKEVKPLSGTRKLHIFQMLNAIFNAAVRDGDLSVNPMKRLSRSEWPKAEDTEMVFLDAAEVDALANAVDPRYRTMVYFLAYTGLRSGEAAALRIEDVRLKEGTVTVDESVSDVKGRLVFGEPKTDRSKRIVHVPAFVTEMLREQVGDRRVNPRAFVFPGANGEPMRMSNFYNRHLKPAARRVLPAEKHGLRLHDLRHTGASLAYLATRDAKAVQDRLGHASITTTMNRYTHLFDETQRDLAERLNELGNAARGSAPAPDATVTELGS